jgi:hypothetical protein
VKFSATDSRGPKIPTSASTGFSAPVAGVDLAGKPVPISDEVVINIPSMVGPGEYSITLKDKDPWNNAPAKAGS